MHYIYKETGKRSFDVTLSIAMIIITLPIMVIIWLLVWINLGYPIIFRQMRPGLKGELFAIYKFRTMIDEKNREGEVSPDFARITRLGNFLRRYSLDELPELINVLKGNMSLIGPRPLLKHYLDLYNNEQMRRHDVRPGITGWAQVHGRNTISWKEKFEFDLWYVNHVSFWVDMKILILTVVNVIKGEGVNQSSTITMDEFTGTN